MGFPKHTPYLWNWGGRQGCRLMKISNTPNLYTFVPICPIYLVCWCFHPKICRATLEPGAGDKDPATAEDGFCLLYTIRVCTPKYAFTLVDAPTGTPPVERKITLRRTLQKTPVASELGIVIRLEWKMGKQTRFYRPMSTVQTSNIFSKVQGAGSKKGELVNPSVICRGDLALTWRHSRHEA